MKYCKCTTCDCYQEYPVDDLCESCQDHCQGYKKPFAEGMNQAFQALEERILKLEADNKRLKRELGLK